MCFYEQSTRPRHTLSANIVTAKTRRILEKFVIFLAVIILSVVISAVEFYMKLLRNKMCIMTL